jgi:hypothetical protein
VRPRLRLRRYHTGAAGAGLLYGSVSAGAALTTLTNRLLGQITIVMVLIWSAAVTAAGDVPDLVAAAALLALAGAADGISGICRRTIAQLVTPDSMRGRITPLRTCGHEVRLGDVESGTVASLTTPRIAVVSGGLACMARVGFVVVAFPHLMRFDAQTTTSLE